MIGSGIINKIKDKLGYTALLTLSGILLPLVIYGAGIGISFIFSHLSFFNLQQFALTISTGLTFNTIFPIMITLGCLGLFIGAVIDVSKIIAKKIQEFQHTRKIALNKTVKKTKSVSKKRQVFRANTRRNRNNTKEYCFTKNKDMMNKKAKKNNKTFISKIKNKYFRGNLASKTTAKTITNKQSLKNKKDYYLGNNSVKSAGR